MKRTNIDATQLELADTVVAIKRVSKTVKGGRTMRFSALVVVGDKNGHVGVGMGKAAEIPEAIRKGKQAAEKNMITVLLKKSPEGTGIIAGGPARSVLEFAGVENIRTKSLGSSNKANVVLATLAGLAALKTPEEVAKRRGKTVEEIIG